MKRRFILTILGWIFVVVPTGAAHTANALAAMKGHPDSRPSEQAKQPPHHTPLAAQTLLHTASQSHPQTSSSSDIKPSLSLAFERLSLEQGLPQSTVNAVLQDKQGFLWVATQDGFCRYDGYSWLIYRHDPQNNASLTDNFIQALYEDAQGTIWIGTRTGGLNAYNRARGTFTAYRHSTRADALPSDLHNDLPSDNVQAICDAGDGQLWIGTNNGLALFNPAQNGKCTVFRADSLNATDSPAGLLYNDIFALHQDRSGTLWIGTGIGLCKYSPTTNTFTSCLQLEGADKRTSGGVKKNNVGLTAYQISTLAGNRAGNIWIGSIKGLGKLDPLTMQMQAVYHSSNSSLPNDDVRAILEDRQGRLWVGTNGGGVCVLNPSTGRGTVAAVEFGNARSLSNNFVAALYQDRQEILWIGTTGGGLNKFDPARSVFTRYGVEPYKKNAGLSDNNAYAFYEDAGGILWIGTDLGLNRFDRSTRTFTAYTHNDNNPASLPHNTINALYEDHTGTFWVGTFGGGLTMFDRTSGRSVNFRHDPMRPTSLSSDRVTAIMEDAKGTLWIATYVGGVCSFDRRTKTFTQYPATPRFVICMYADRVGKLWLGTQSEGLVVFDPATGTCIKRYKNEPSNPRSISSNAINSLYEDAKGALWIATSNGLNKLPAVDVREQSFTVIREKNGLPNDVLYSVLPDGRGYLWLSSNKGVARYAPSTGKVESYTTSDGLQSNEFNQGSYHRGRSGRMYFGGVNGFNEFFPDSIRRNIFVPPVVLTDFKKFNKSVTLDTSISQVSAISLDYTDNVFSFEFAALNFSLSEKNRYAFQLEGFDKDWVDAGSRREATYTNLEPRTYTFRVKASNNDGVWNEVGTSVQVVIHPPWWKTWWFRTLAIIAAVVGALSWYRLRVYQVQARNLLLERQVEERTHELRDRSEEIERQNRQLVELNKDKNEIMGIVAHDLKNPLSNIMMLAKLLDQESGHLSQAEIQEFAHDIQMGSTRMFELINNLLNVNAIEQGGIKLQPVDFDLYGLVQMLVHDYHPSAEAKHIALHFENCAGEDGIVTAFADRNAVTQVLDNVISNAIKYSPHDKNVYVRLLPGRTTGRVCVSVQDEGPGLSDQDKQQLFGKFARLSAQPTGGEHSTGLGLSIVKKLVEALNGQIWCDSELGHGATFTVELPSHW
jgi:ligand-binding sensor domain-containing protein/signal transduction histidine kinase